MYNIIVKISIQLNKAEIEDYDKLSIIYQKKDFFQLS